MHKKARLTPVTEEVADWLTIVGGIIGIAIAVAVVIAILKADISDFFIG